MIDNPGGQEEEDEDEMMNKTRSPCLRSLYRLHVRMFKPKKVELNTTEKVMELLQPVRYKPTSVAEMAEEMRLSSAENEFQSKNTKLQLPPNLQLNYCCNSC